MITPNYFDNIQGVSFLSDICESYFDFGKLSAKFGYRKYNFISSGVSFEGKKYLSIEEDTSHNAPTFISTLLKTLQIFSYFIGIPFIMLAGKAAFRLFNSFKIISPNQPNVPIPFKQNAVKSTEGEIQQSQLRLKTLWETYKNCNSPDLFNCIQHIEVDSTSSRSGSVSPVPDVDSSNLISEFENDTEVFFIPDVYYKNPFEDDGGKFPGRFDFLKSVLIDAFRIGKKLVVTRLSNSCHSVAALFTNLGKVKIIDGLSSDTIDLNFLIKNLNEAQIKNSEGAVIQFEGEYVHTHLQEEWVYCMRFATLYAYHSAKRRSLDAYKEVNAAFAKNKLVKFEDCLNIDINDNLADARDVSRSQYTKFMKSWSYRSGGYKSDTWDEITLENIIQRADLRLTLRAVEPQNKVIHQRGVFILTRESCIDFAMSIISNQSGFAVTSLNLKPLFKEAEAPNLRFKHLSDKSTTLGSLIPTDDVEKVVLIIEKEKTPFICSLKNKERLCLISRKEGKEIFVPFSKLL